MPDVFISYAREDELFVERLRGALRDRGREVWLDRATELGEGIEPGDQWQRSATEAIDRSDVFVFVLSASSLASRPCRDELRHAADVNKRLIPVCIEEPAKGAEIPDPLRDLSWVMMRPQDDFEAGIEALIHAIDTDIEVVREHTRILVRAKAWELADRRASPLLRGEELRVAEDWMSRAATARAAPTDLQRDFILASRRAASRRQRQAITGSLAVAAIAIALSIFAFIQRGQARRQARLAESRQLAASAEASLGTDPEQSVSLAERGVRVQATPQAVHALWSALTASRLRADLRGPSPVESVAFSPDGAELVVGSDDGAVRAWRLADHHLMWTEGRGQPPASSLAFAAAGDVLVVGRAAVTAGAPGCSVEVLNATTGLRERALGPAGGGACLRFVGFVGSGRVVAVGADGGAVQFWNVDQGRALGSSVQVIPPADAPASGLAISEDGRELAVLAVHKVQVVSLGSGRPIATIQTSSSVPVLIPSAVAFSPDGSELMVSGEYGAQIYYLGAHTLSGLYSQDGSTQSAAWAGDGRVLASGAGYLGVDVWANSTRLVEVLHGSSPKAFSAVAFSPTGLLAGGSKDGSVRVWAPDPDRPDYALPVPASFDPGQAYGAAAAHLAAIGDARSGVVVVDDIGRQVGKLTPNGDGPFAVGAGGELAFTRTGTLYVWRLPAGQLVRSWKLPSNAAPSAVAASADGRMVATIGANGAVTSSSARGTVTAAVPVAGLVSPAVSITPNGRMVAVTATSGIRILDTMRLQLVRSESGIAATFSASGNLIAIQRGDLSIAIIRTTDWRTQATVRGEPAQAAQLSFSPDGRLLAALGNDGVLRVWDTSDGTLISTRQIIESGLVAQRTQVPPVVLTAAGFALVGDAAGNAIHGYVVCAQCFNAPALLAQADARLAEVAPVTAP